jgi:hypothetical protein
LKSWIALAAAQVLDAAIKPPAPCTQHAGQFKTAGSGDVAGNFNQLVRHASNRGKSHARANAGPRLAGTVMSSVTKTFTITKMSVNHTAKPVITPSYGGVSDIETLTITP